MRQKGIMFVVSGPSGSGKSTVIKEFLKKHRKDFALSVSATTRPPRTGESDGKDYYFYSAAKFKRLIKQGNFLEYAKVLDNFYGTPRQNALDNINSGRNVIMDIDVQGATKIRAKVRNCATIFIITPSFSVLKSRLCNRKTDSKESIKKRLALAKKELKQRGEYDYIIVNKDLKKAVGFIECVVALEQFRRYKI